MGKLGDFLTDKEKKSYINSNIKPGKVLRLFCNFTDPPKEKYVVLVHSNSESKLPILVVNSKINEFIKKRGHLLNCQVEIKHSDYPFLDHNSFIDCAKVKYFDKTHIKKQLLSDIKRIKGTLTQETKNKIIDAVDGSKTIRPQHQKLIMDSLE